MAWCVINVWCKCVMCNAIRAKWLCICITRKATLLYFALHVKPLCFTLHYTYSHFALLCITRQATLLYFALHIKPLCVMQMQSHFYNANAFAATQCCTMQMQSHVMHVTPLCRCITRWATLLYTLLICSPHYTLRVGITRYAFAIHIPHYTIHMTQLLYTLHNATV